MLHSDDAKQYQDGVLHHLTLENNMSLLSRMHGNGIVSQVWNRDL